MAIIGHGSATSVLSEGELEQLTASFIGQEGLSSKRVLAIIPDHTRTAPMDVMFRVLYRLLATGAGKFDVLIALGTHPPMSERAIEKRLGIPPGARASMYPNTRIFNHAWNDPDALRQTGTLTASVVSELSQGLMREEVRVSINRLVFDYDTLLIVGPTFPHEVVGFSGGNKYLFPGIAGEEILNMFHWLGALLTNQAIIGTKTTPVRSVVDAAASLVPVPKLCMSLVVSSEGTHGLYCGTPEDAWSAAADLSAAIHIRRMDRSFTSVLSCPALMYDELWVAAKAAYKLEPVVADGGELIIYAPHVREISVTHGALIERIGYHVRDFFAGRLDEFKDIPLGVLAHSTHVKGAGTYINGRERPRIHVTLATGIPQETCERINLGYRDPATIDPADWQGRESDGRLYVPNAGETLFRLKDVPAPSL